MKHEQIIDLIGFWHNVGMFKQQKQGIMILAERQIRVTTRDETD